MTIRNFVYLDTEKIRSISSQIFEGITDHFVQSNINSSSEETSQKGPLNSGRILADIFSTQEKFSSTTFLADHAFAIFEKKNYKIKIF